MKNTLENIIESNKNNIPIPATIESKKTWDMHSDKRIKMLHPDMQNKAADFINEVKKTLNINLRIGPEVFRSVEEQEKIYNSDKKISNARGGQSYHNYGLAFDVYPIYGNGFLKLSEEKWKKIGEIGKKYGFEWGGDWSNPDRPHFQMTFGYDWKELIEMFPDIEKYAKENGYY